MSPRIMNHGGKRLSTASTTQLLLKFVVSGCLAKEPDVGAPVAVDWFRLQWPWLVVWNMAFMTLMDIWNMDFNGF